MFSMSYVSESLMCEQNDSRQSPMKSRCFHLNKLALSVVLMVMPFFSTSFATVKAVIVIAALVIALQSEFTKLFDLTFVLLFIALLYCSIGGFFQPGEVGVSPSLLLLPVSLYLAGKSVGIRMADESGIIKILLLISFLLSFQTIISIIINIYDNGFVYASRNIELIGSEGIQVSATVLAGNLVVAISLIGLIFCNGQAVSPIYKIAILILVTLSMVSVLRLGSRTQLLIGVVSILSGYLLNRKSGHLLLNTIFFTLVAVVVFFVVRSLDDLNLFNYYLDRLDDNSASVGSAGGRTTRWLGAFSLMASHPFGWDLAVLGFAHNLWLDAARVGGVPAFLFMCLFSIIALYLTARVIYARRQNRAFVTAVACLTSGFYLLFVVEPILDGFIYVFSAYCAFLGVLNGLNRQFIGHQKSSIFLAPKSQANEGLL